MKRPDLDTLLRFSVDLGLRTTVTPSATPLLTEEAVRRMIQRCGVARMAINAAAKWLNSVAKDPRKSFVPSLFQH